jgi:hypothetical protein
MSAEEQPINITKCSRCHMRHKDDMFGTNRLGERFKTCNTCREKNKIQKKAYRENNKDKIAEQQKEYRENNKDKIAERQKEHRAKNACEHGVYKHTCYTCASGKMFCEHKLNRTRCIVCTPSNFCEHSKHLRLKCQHCNPELFCFRHVEYDVVKQIIFCRQCESERAAAAAEAEATN